MSRSIGQNERSFVVSHRAWLKAREISFHQSGRRAIILRLDQGRLSR